MQAFNFFYKNWLNLSGISVVGIISLGLTLYFGVFAKHEQIPVFITDYTPSRISDTHLLDKFAIQVIKPNGEEAQKPIYSQIFYFWNAGRKTIEREDILSDGLAIS